MQSAIRFPRGANIILALDAATGDPGIVDDIVAELRRVEGGGGVDHAADPAAVFNITERAAAAGVPAGWTLEIDAETSEALQLGKYRTDARITVAGGRSWSEQLDIQIFEGVTAP